MSDSKVKDTIEQLKKQGKLTESFKGFEKLGKLTESFKGFGEKLDVSISSSHSDSLNIDALDFRNYKLVDYMYEVLRDRIKEFESNLDEEHEVVLQLASFSKEILLYIDEIEYSNPCILVFKGTTTNGEQATLIQHMSMLNFLLLSEKKKDPGRPARRIGFI
jgi:hypothetical protein